MSETFTLGLFYTVIRPEEKWILAAAEERGIPVERLHDEAVTFPLVRNGFQADLVLNRSVSHSRSLYALRFFEHYGVPTVNRYEVVALCGDKVLASLRLEEAGVPTPRTVVALTPEAALKALDEIGYPAVLKPPIGSWGRLMAKVDDAEEAEQIRVYREAGAGSPRVRRRGRDRRGDVSSLERLAHERGPRCRVGGDEPDA